MKSFVNRPRWLGVRLVSGAVHIERGVEVALLCCRLVASFRPCKLRDRRKGACCVLSINCGTVFVSVITFALRSTLSELSAPLRPPLGPCQQDVSRAGLHSCLVCIFIRKVYCSQLAVGACFLIQSDDLCLLIGVFGSSAFSVSVDVVRFKSRPSFLHVQRLEGPCTFVCVLAVSDERLNSIVAGDRKDGSSDLGPFSCPFPCLLSVCHRWGV